ncbi:MAG: hypothetical protein ACKVX7_17405 [Planctomycetota bacterium]
MHYYASFGLSIASEFEIDELEPTAAPVAECDVKIRAATISDRPRIEAGAPGRYRATPKETCLAWSGVGGILVRDGREIIVDAEPGADWGLLRVGLLGAAFCPLLQQRGIFPLHASVVSLPNEHRTVAFCGATGAGKSTMAATLIERGFELWADDVAAIKIRALSAQVFAAYPNLKLWPAALTQLGGRPNELPRVHFAEEKRLRRVARAQITEPSRRLTAIYVLDYDDQVVVDRLDSQAAVVELLRHAYNAALQFAALGPAELFRRVTEVAARVPVYRLARPRDLARLREVADQLAAHAAGSS